MIPGRHRASERAPGRRSVAGAIPWRAFVVAVLGGGLVLVIVGWEWIQTRDRPLEHTVVVSVVPADGHSRCGRRHLEDNQAVTRRSTDPPSGLPTVFTDVEACDVPTVGDRQTLVRVPRGTKDPKVYVDPIQSLGWVVGVTSLLGVLLFVGTVVVLGAIEVWHSWRRRRAARRRTA